MSSNDPRSLDEVLLTKPSRTGRRKDRKKGGQESAARAATPYHRERWDTRRAYDLMDDDDDED